MVTLDLRKVSRMLILVLDNKPENILMTARPGAPNLTGATAIMVITKGVVIATLTIGAGLTIPAPNQLVVSLPGLPQGVYNYNLEITPVTGEVIRVIHQIQSSYE